MTGSPEHDQPEPQRHLRDVDAADPADPPIVLVPGIDGTALLFYRQIPSLARRFDVVAFPLPTADPSRMTMDSLADDLASLVAEVSEDGAILCGESFGGILSLTTALRHPGLIRGLVIVNSFPFLDQRVRLALAPKLLRAVPWSAMPLVRRYTSSQLHSSHTLDEDLREFAERAKAIDGPSYIRRLEILRTLDVRSDLERIEAPTIFLAGDEDRLVPSVRWARFMHERVPGSELEILEGYGHVCLINHDLHLIGIVEPWWDRIREA